MRERLIQSFQDLADSMVSAVPQVVMALVLIVVSLVVASVVERVLRYILTKVNIDSLIGKVGADSALQRLGVRPQLTILVPRIVYFLVLLLLARTAVDALGLTAISEAIAAFFAYLPNVVAALLLLVLGSSLGQVAGQTVARSAEASGIEFAPTLGRLVSSLIIFVTAMMAVGQLQIDTEIIHVVTSLVLGGAALAFGLSFGLGTRDIVRNVVAGFYVRRFLEVGEPLEVDGQHGTLNSITATHVILVSNNQKIAISNETLMHQVVKQ